MTIVILGIDLAKNVFSLHGVDRADKAVWVRPGLRQIVRHDQMLEIVAKLLPCSIGIEACSGARHCAREFAKYGHTVKLIVRIWVRTRRGTTRLNGSDYGERDLSIFVGRLFSGARHR